jgi:large subunit ribosomal protein L17
MRHRKRGRKLDRAANQRKALKRSVALAMITQFGVENREYIVTTTARAKEFRPFVEKLITLGRRARANPESTGRQIALRRQALRLLPNRPAVKKIFDEIAHRYADRPGGYTRIVRTGSYRLGDGAQKVLFAFVSEGSEATAAAPVLAKK